MVTVEVRIPVGILAPLAGFSDQEQVNRIENASEYNGVQFGGQRMAVCDATGLLAVANGRVVDLYHADAMHIPEHNQTENQDHTNGKNAHLPFAGQIILQDHLEAYLSTDQVDASIYAPCVAFVAPGFLLVTAATVDTVSSSWWLVGFRIYSRTVAMTQHYGSSSVLVHSAFVDSIPGNLTVSDIHMLPPNVFSTRDAGAAVVLFREVSCFGVFQWSERFSDRILSIARVSKTVVHPVTALTISDDARWIAMADTSGGVYVIDCRRFGWDMTRRFDPQTVDPAMGKRLVLDLTVRMGRVITNDHPLDVVRVVHQVRTGAMNSFATCLLWWKPSTTSRSSQYLLMGQNDGALAVMALKKGKDKKGEQNIGLKTVEIYPALRSFKKDSLLIISPPEYCAQDNLFKFSTITRTSWRQWTVGVISREDANKLQVQWPTLRDSLGLRTFEVQGHGAYGSQLLLASTNLARQIVNAVSCQHHPTPMWLLVVDHHEIRAIAQLEEPLPTKAASEIREPEPVVSIPKSNNEVQRDEEEPLPAEPDPIPDTQHTVLTTLQDRYMLPSRKGSREAALNEVTPVNETFSMAPSTNQRLTKDEYNARLVSMTQRIDRLSTNLHALRTSFHLFTDDVQEHMTFISTLLEELHDQGPKE